MNPAQELEQQAADWLVRAEEPHWSAADQQMLEDWLDQSMAHKAAYWRLRHGWREADRVAVIGVSVPGQRGMRRFLAPSWQWAIAVSLLLTTGVGLQNWLRRGSDVDVPLAQFSTPVGGHRLVKLDDGSVLELNTATRVRAAVTPDHREVWLDQGEALFQVAHLQNSPFVVHAGDRTVTDLGTKFSVRRDGAKTVVAVLEGKVRIADTDSTSAVPTAILAARNMAVAQGRSTLLTTLTEDSIQSRLAWRNGYLQFDQTSLADAAQEFNRYNRVQIVIRDDDTAKIKISGSFQVSNVDAFVRLLHTAYGLSVETSQGSVVIAG